MSEMIGRLRVALGLETASFERGAKRAAAEINTFGSKAEQAGLKVGSMARAVALGGAAIAGSAIVGQIKDMVTAGLDYASALGEQAQQLGVTAKAMQEYRAVASQTGVSNEEMDAALARLTRTTGDAAGGGKKASAAFDSLGISVRDANGKVKDAGDLIPEIAGALEKIPSPAERASKLVDLFGKSGQKLAPLMAEGADGINKLRDEARQLGLVLSDEQIQKADATADKIAQLNNQFNVRVAATVADNADSIMKLVEALAALAEKILKLVDLGAKLANSPVGRFIGMGLDSAGSLGIGSDNLRKLEQQYRERQKGGAAPVAPTVSMSPAWNKGRPAPLLQVGSPYNGLRTNFAGGSTLMPSAASTFAGMQPGEGKSWADIVWDQNDRWAAVRGELADDTRKTAEVIDKSSLDIEAANERVTRSFEDMANNSLNALQSLVNAVQSGDVVGILQNILGLGQSLGVFGGGNGFGSAASINKSTLDSIRSSSLPTLPAYAGGTNFHPGGLALVGERGPEIVRLPRGAGVTPNHALGGGVVHNYFQGNLLTPEFWQRITQQDAQAAVAGGEMGYRKVVTKSRRRLA